MCGSLGNCADSASRKSRASNISPAEATTTVLFRPRSVRGRQVTDRFRGHVCTDLRDGQVAGDGDDVGHRELPDHGPGTNRLGERPLQGGQGIVVVLQPPVRVADVSPVAPLAGDLAGGAGSLRRVPAAEPVRDVRLVGRGPVPHRRGGEQVTETAVEGHRGDDRHAGGAGAVGEVRERVGVGLDFSRHVHVRDLRAQCRLDHRGGRRGEGAGAVDHRGGAGQ